MSEQIAVPQPRGSWRLIWLKLRSRMEVRMDTLTAYDAPDEELMDRLIRAAATAGTATSGLCFDPAAGLHIAQMRYLKGVVLARLAGKKPPFQPDARVVTGDQDVHDSSRQGPYLLPKFEGTVRRVLYAGGDWFLELEGIIGMYRADAFRLATPKQENAPAMVG